jgi:beta-N-acetylhexosaminidase
MSRESLCGGLIIGGFQGLSLPASYARSLRENKRGGAILFKHNVLEGPHQIAALARAVHAASPAPLLGIDQEGGRVARLRAPFIAVPAMSRLAGTGDTGFAETIAHAVASELAAVGCTINFAPVLDVNTCPCNPAIGDRAFGADAEVCAQFGTAWIRGIESAGLLAAAKHFPGHGDTSTDSHFDLPVVDQSLARLERVELAPFRAAIDAGVRAMMTAHVVYPALDPGLPATLSRLICTSLRERLGFRGMLLSDDLEMRAVADRWGIGDAAIAAVAAGCDALLICHGEDAQEAALEAMVRESERSPTFTARCEQARARVRRARSHVRVQPGSDSEVTRVVGGSESRLTALQIAEKFPLRG